MFKRLVAVLLFALAVFAPAVSTPAYASTLNVGVDCVSYGYYNGFYRIGCATYITGGTGSYPSIVWTVSRRGYSSTIANNSEDLVFTCALNAYHSVSVTVTDSAGETGTGIGGTTCRAQADFRHSR